MNRMEVATWAVTVPVRETMAAPRKTNSVTRETIPSTHRMEDDKRPNSFQKYSDFCRSPLYGFRTFPQAKNKENPHHSGCGFLFFRGLGLGHTSSLYACIIPISHRRATCFCNKKTVPIRTRREWLLNYFAASLEAASLSASDSAAAPDSAAC